MKEMKSKKNRVKRLVGVICLLVMFIIGNIYPTYVFAQVNESEIESEETQETASKDNIIKKKRKYAFRINWRQNSLQVIIKVGTAKVMV